MSVEITDEIDLVSESKKNGTVNLIISDHLPWEDIGTHLVILQRKIERYLVFIRSGEILTLSPFSKDKPKVIQIYFMIEPPTGTATKFLSEMKRSMKRAGVGLEWGVFDGAI
ncbi:MAG: hypothetical protein SynsKO_13290 [Synoicihabitans sp.]